MSTLELALRRAPELQWIFDPAKMSIVQNLANRYTSRMSGTVNTDTTTSDAIDMIIVCMEVVEEVGVLSGSEKRDVVILIVSSILIANQVDDTVVQFVLDHGANIANVTIKASRGLFRLNLGFKKFLIRTFPACVRSCI